MISEPTKTQKSSIVTKKKPNKLYKNLVYDFDLFIRAATMIQAQWRGFAARHRVLRCATFTEFRKHVVTC